MNARQRARCQHRIRDVMPVCRQPKDRHKNLMFLFFFAGESTKENLTASSLASFSCKNTLWNDSKATCQINSCVHIFSNTAKNKSKIHLLSQYFVMVEFFLKVVSVVIFVCVHSSFYSSISKSTSFQSDFQYYFKC